MQVHLVDGTYELYRQHFGQATRHSDPPPFAGTIGVLTSTIQLLQDGATHIGVATDHVIESFRNDLYDGYKTSEGMEPVLLEQIPILEDALRAMGGAGDDAHKAEGEQGLGGRGRHGADTGARVRPPSPLVIIPRSRRHSTARRPQGAPPSRCHGLRPG